MHTLTKIFIVLQALLSVFILALVVPLAVNQDHWKSEAQKQQGAADQARASLEQAQAQHAADAATHLKEVARLTSEKSDLEQQINSRDQLLIDVRSRLGDAQLASTEVRAQLDTLTATTKTQSSIIGKQGDEITQRRNESLATQKRAIDLEDKLRDSLTRLDVAIQATKILQEQLTKAQALAAGGSETTTGSEEDLSSHIASPLVQGRVLRVEDDPAGTRYAVVDLGSRDGLSENMRFLISRGGSFMGYLTLTTVDINRSVGKIELEQSDGVRVSDDVHGGVN